MDKQELACNIQILESLGWFIAEDEETEGFDVLLKCCRPDWTVLEVVPVTDFLLSLYDEEDGSLEARLWFFAPKYATSLDNLEVLLTEGNESYEYSVRSEVELQGKRYYEAEITRLDYDYEVFEISSHYGTSDISSSMALSEAYLRCVGVYDG